MEKGKEGNGKKERKMTEGMGEILFGYSLAFCSAKYSVRVLH